MDPMGLTLQSPSDAAAIAAIAALQADVTTLLANMVVLTADVGEVFDLANAGLILQETGGTLTADGTEQTLYINDDPQGVHKPAVCLIDLDNMTGVNTTLIRVYYRIIDGGGLLMQDYATYIGADGGLLNGEKMIEVALSPTRFGFHVTLEQTAGTNRDYDWEYIEEA